MPKDVPKECPQPRTRVLSVFYANITSLSPHAKNYIFSLPKSVHAFAGVELHKIDKLETENVFKFHGYNASYTPAEKLQTMSHGGEIVAAKASYNTRPAKDT